MLFLIFYLLQDVAIKDKQVNVKSVEKFQILLTIDLPTDGARLGRFMFTICSSHHVVANRHSFIEFYSLFWKIINNYVKVHFSQSFWYAYHHLVT